MIKNNKKLVVALIIVLSVAVLAVLSYFIFFSKGTQSGLNEKSTENAFNIINNEEIHDDYNAVCNKYINALYSSISSKKISYVNYLKNIIEIFNLDDKEELDDNEVIDIAKMNNLINLSIEKDIYHCISRTEAAKIIVDFLEYKSHKDDVNIIDIPNKFDDAELKTCIYLGYFSLDEENKSNPNKALSVGDYNNITNDLRKVVLLKGKTVLGIGDSIMRGSGNKGMGIPELLEEKYKMVSVDYSLARASFGVIKDKPHITDQIDESINDKVQPDIILLNGGANDMFHGRLGEISNTLSYENIKPRTFCSGMEYTIGKLKENFQNVPIIYIFCHSLYYVDEEEFETYENHGEDICKKWDVSFLDINEKSQFDRYDPEIIKKYTCKTSGYPNGDSVHPTQIGYYKFYIPYISDSIYFTLKG